MNLDVLLIAYGLKDSKRPDVVDLNSLFKMENAILLNYSFTDEYIFVALKIKLNIDLYKIPIESAVEATDPIHFFSQDQKCDYTKINQEEITIGENTKISDSNLFCTKTHLLLSFKSQNDKHSVFIYSLDNNQLICNLELVDMNFCADDELIVIIGKESYDSFDFTVHIYDQNQRSFRKPFTVYGITAENIPMTVFENYLYLFYDRCLRKIDITSDDPSATVRRIDHLPGQNQEIIALHGSNEIQLDNNKKIEAGIYALIPGSLTCYRISFDPDHLDDIHQYPNPNIFIAEIPIEKPAYNEYGEFSQFRSMNWTKSTTFSHFIWQYSYREYMDENRIPYRNPNGQKDCINLSNMTELFDMVKEK